MRASRTSTWSGRLAAVALFLVCAGTAISGQAQGAAELESALAPGMTVWILDRSGREEEGRVLDVTGGIVTTTAGETIRRLRTTDVLRVRARRSDSLINGALIGAGVAVGAGLAFCNLTESWENCLREVGPPVRVGAIGAGIGIGIDALIRGRKTIYEAPREAMELHVAPIVTRDARGVQVSFSF